MDSTDGGSARASKKRSTSDTASFEGSKIESKKQRKLEKAFRVGTWSNFHREDAALSRKAFITWLSSTYLPQDNPVGKDIKAQLHGLLEQNTNERAELLPGTINILEMWESVPLVEGSRQWGIARARLVGSLLSNGSFQASQEQGLVVTPREIAEAHCWLHKGPDGTVLIFEPIRQPWYHKDLRWIVEADGAGTTKGLVEVPKSDWRIEIEMAKKDSENPEALRISSETLHQLIHSPTSVQETTLQHDARNEDAEAPQPLGNTAEKAHDAADQPGNRAHNHTPGGKEAFTQPLHPNKHQVQDGEDSDEPVVTSTKSIGKARNPTKKEADAVERDATGGTSTTSQSLESMISEINALHPVITRNGGRSTRSTQSRLTTGPFDEHGLLEVSEDEEDDFDRMVKMEELPRDEDSKNHPRFHQGDDAQSEGNSSDVQIIERNGGPSNSGDDGVDRSGRERLTTPSTTSSNMEEQYSDVEVETEGQAYAIFASRGYPSPERRAAELFGTNRRDFGEIYDDDDDDVADSEATTEILDRDDDDEMTERDGGSYDEQDKENHPASGVENELGNNGDDRLEVRIVEGAYEYVESDDDEVAVVSSSTLSGR
ncbi:MAG: hypothetical protein Q9168_003103 [Polycauliona sp. 1 TL-2023]